MRKPIREHGEPHQLFYPFQGHHEPNYSDCGRICLRKCCSGTLLRVIDNLERQFDTQLEPEEEIDQDILDIRDSIHYLKLRKKARGHYDELYNLESVLSSLSMEDRHSDGDRDDAQTPEADQTTTIKQDLQRIRDEVKAVAL
ncbi:hypothetical protein EV182_004306, partial [Spiromyces aspiralis]